MAARRRNERQLFHGEIAGLGTSSGLRVVVGMWRDTPYGSFADVMLQEQDGHRTLFAPTDQVAEFIATTYVFDHVVITPVDLTVDGDDRRVRTGELDLTVTVGRRTPIGRLLAIVPRPISRAPWWLTVIDPIARVALAGVRTRGTAGSGRHEYYGAHDLHHLTAVRGTWRGQSVGQLTDVDPPVTFGFGSTPRRPGITGLTTTVIVAGSS